MTNILIFRKSDGQVGSRVERKILGNGETQNRERLELPYTNQTTASKQATATQGSDFLPSQPARHALQQ